jgi:hypothetical protein
MFIVFLSVEVVCSSYDNSSLAFGMPAAESAKALNFSRVFPKGRALDVMAGSCNHGAAAVCHGAGDVPALREGVANNKKPQAIRLGVCRKH